MASRPTRAIAAAWLVAAGIGLAAIASYQNAAGAFGQTPTHWPAQTGLASDADRATLVMFAHPRCPCTRASIEELNRLLTKLNGKVAAHVYFFQPADQPPDWSQTDLWRSAAAIPGVVTHEDRDGAQARRFGAETSGFVALYSAPGTLLFKGGITAGRGHAGDNVGASSIVSLLTTQTAGASSTPVYGCSLLDGCDSARGETICQH